MRLAKNGFKYTQALLFGFVVVAASMWQPAPVSAAFNPNILIDDVVFEDYGSMNPEQINAFLNAKASSCISQNNGFVTPDPQGWSTSQGAYTFGGNVSGGQAIFDTAQRYHVNPRVILSTLQKEQTIVTGGVGCHPNTPDPASATPMTNQCGSGTRNCTLACTFAGGCMTIAMGNACPNYCDVRYEGFSMQIISAAWMLRFAQQRALGNLTGYAGYDQGDESYTYSGPMTAGYRKRSASSPLTYYDGTYTTADSVGTTIGSGATASLYSYTPFIHGNQNFVNIFEDWFGSTISAGYYACHNSNNMPWAASGGSVISSQSTRGQVARLVYSQLNNTGTRCIEAHTWQPGYQSWITNIATNMPAADPENVRIISADTDGDGQDELLYIHYMGTGTGKIEIHTWKPGYQGWITNIPTNLPCAPPSHGQVIAGNVNGDGRDALMYVQYTPTGSGKIEVHTWKPGYQSWLTNIATNLGSAPPTYGQVIAGNVNGDGRDALMYVQYQNTGSGKVEVHTLKPGYQSFLTNIATNLYSAPPTYGQVIAGNVNGDGRDALMYVQYQNTGSGKVEVHTWKPGYQNFLTDIATNLNKL